MKFRLFFILFLFPFLSFSQTKKEDKQVDYIQFSGKVVQVDTGKPIQGVRVTNLTRGLITLSNDKGHFTIVAAANDKIQLSHIGMAHQFLTIPDQEGSKIYKDFALAIEDQEIQEVLINGLPSLDELGDRLMAMDIDNDPARQLALDNPDVFNILDTIIAHEPALIAFKNGKVESSPISWFYEKVYKKIKERLPKPNRKEILPEFKE